MDRMDKINATALALALTTVGIFLFMFVTPNRPLLILAFIISFGIGWGGLVPMLSGLVILFFGRYRMATITGCIGSVMMVGILFGAPFAGWTFDVYGSYKAAWLVFGVMMGVATVAFYFLLHKLKRSLATA
jgi:MFS family permease